MRRVVLGAESLKTFTSAGHDDHVKIFFPIVSSCGEPAAAARDFTPRKIDTERGLLTIDFALHESGVAMAWARQAKIGDTLEIGGPRGSHVLPDDFDWYWMIGDETAIPAIGRRLEELRPQACVTTIIVVNSERDRLPLQTAAAWTPIWLYRADGNPSDERLIRGALGETAFPPGDGHLWLAGESGMIRSLRSYLIDERGHRSEWVRAAGYWKRGSAGAHEHF